MSVLENGLDIDYKKQYRMLIFGDIVLKFERGFAHYGAPATATIIGIQSKIDNLFSEKKSFHFHCLSFCNFVSVIFRVILTLGKQTLKSYPSEETRIMPVVKRAQE